MSIVTDRGLWWTYNHETRSKLNWSSIEIMQKRFKTIGYFITVELRTSLIELIDSFLIVWRAGAANTYACFPSNDKLVTFSSLTIGIQWRKSFSCITWVSIRPSLPTYYSIYTCLFAYLESCQSGPLVDIWGLFKSKDLNAYLQADFKGHWL